MAELGNLGFESASKSALQNIIIMIYYEDIRIYALFLKRPQQPKTYVLLV